MRHSKTQRKWWQRFRIIAVATLMAGSVGLGQVDETPVYGGSLTILIPEEVRHLDTIFDGGTEGRYVGNQITDGLVNTDGEGRIVPGLAESWEMTDDVTYVFHLRQGVSFHDGTPFTAADVVYNWNRIMDPGIGYAAPRIRTFIESVEALDDYTVRVTIPAPSIEFLDYLAPNRETRIHSPAAIEQWGQDYGLRAVVGTGPFKFEEWVRNDRIRLVRNDDYWADGLPYLDEITFVPMPEAATRILTFESGEADVIFNPPLDALPRFSSDERFVVNQTAGGTLLLMFFNTSKEPFDDIRVRQALSYAVDRAEISEALYYGYMTPASGVFPPWHAYHDPAWEATTYPYDPARARELLAEAGFDDSNPLTFQIFTTSDTQYVDLSVLLQAQLTRIGVNVQIIVQEKAGYSAELARMNWSTAVYRLGKGKLVSDHTWRSYSPQSPTQYTMYNSPGGYQNPEVAAMIEEALTIADPEENLSINRRISEIVLEDATRLLIGFVDTTSVRWSYVHNLGIDVIHDYSLSEVWRTP